VTGIDQQGNLGEGKKGNTDGQDDVERSYVVIGDIIKRGYEKIRIFEKPEKEQVNGYCRSQPLPAVFRRGEDDPFADKIVHKNRSQKNGNKPVIP
jgi:hypothetical protein